MRRLATLLLALVLWLNAGAAAADLVVVVNARCGVAALTRAEVVNLFFGRSRQFFNGTEARPVDLPDQHPDRARFYAALVGKQLPEVNAYWARQVFSGALQPLPRVATPEDVLRHVAAHASAVGFIDAAKVDARVRVVFELKE